MKIAQQLNTTFQNTQDDKFKCFSCKDTTWVFEDGNYKRCSCYEKEVTRRRWQKFGVNPGDVKLIAEYKATSTIKLEARNAAINYIKNFDIIREQRNSSIALLGQPGAGKTHLALAIGKALLERKEHVGVMYMPYLEAMRELKACVMDDEHYNKTQARYIDCELLIIDDLFKDKVKKGKLVGELREADIKHIYPIINQRYINHAPTIYSSECNANMLLDLDEALGGRIIESCKDNIIIFKYCRENNYRMEGI